MEREPTRVLLLRHGQSTWNAEGRWQGQADPPLSALGEEQARAAAGALGPVDLIVASDLARARQTAEIIAEARGLVIRVDPRLREVDMGPWSGLTRAEIEASWPGWVADGRRPVQTETTDEVADRVVAALRSLNAAHPDTTVLAVAHGGAIRHLERRLDDLTDVARNVSGRWFVVDGDRILPGEVVSLLDAAVAAPTADRR
jgi:probable phosphoglycerate mutase